MNQSLEYAIGLLDGNIHDFLLGIGRPAKGMSHALITCLDSSLQPASIVDRSESLSPLKQKLSIVGEGLLIATRDLLLAERKRRIFFGFDELWFVSRRNIQPKPADLHLVGPNRPTEAEVLRHESWLKESGCSLALGDGAGLNFCVRASGAAKLLLRVLQESVHA